MNEINTQNNSQPENPQPDPLAVSPIEKPILVDVVEPQRANAFANDPSLHVLSDTIFDFGRDQVLQPDVYTILDDKNGLSHHIESAEIIKITKSKTEPEASIVIETTLSREEVDQNIQANNTVEILEEPDLEQSVNTKAKNIKVRLIIAVTVGCLFTAGVAIKHHFDKKSS